MQRTAFASDPPAASTTAARFSQAAPRLPLDVVLDELAGARLERDLAGAEEQVAGADRLAVGADGGGGGVGVDLSAVGHGPQTTEPKLRPLAPPETKYARSGDVHIAYQVFGEGDLDLVLVTGFVTHVELIWEAEPSARFLEALGVVRARDQLRPARLRAVGPGGRRAHARGAHGRRARRDGRRRLRAGGADGDLRGRADEHPVRRHLPRARARRSSASGGMARST